MSDHQGAYEFGVIFRELAKDGPIDVNDFAAKMWKLALKHDFWWGDMAANEALAKFGLARKRVDPKDPEGGEVWFYGPEGADRS